MGRAIKAEIRKLTTTRLWWGMAIGIVVVGAGISSLIASFASKGSGQTDLDLASQVYTGGMSLGYLLLLVIGILTVGTEYRHKTITSSILSVPNRVQLMSAKIVALLLFGVVYGVLFVVSAVVAGAAILGAKSEAVFPESGQLIRTLLLCLLVLGLWALIGLGLGILIPNQVAALLLGVALAFIVEPIAANILANVSWGGTASKYFPSRATAAILDRNNRGGDGSSAPLLSWWGGTIVLAVYAAIFSGLGTFLTKRRDIL